MSIQTITVHAFEQEAIWLFNVVNGFIQDAGWTLAAHRPPVPCRPKRVGNYVVPYYFAGDLRMLYEYARNEREVTRDFIEDTIGRVLRLLFTSPLQMEQGSTVEPDWEFLKSRALGVMLLAARGRARLSAGEWISFDELHALTGVKESRLERLGVETRPEDGTLVCEPETVQGLLERLEQKD